MEVIPTVSEIIGISDHLGGFLFRRGCPGEKAWFSPRSTPAMGSLTRVVPQPPTPPGLTTSPQASLPARPAVGLSATGILSEAAIDRILVDVTLIRIASIAASLRGVQRNRTATTCEIRHERPDACA